MLAVAAEAQCGFPVNAGGSSRAGRASRTSTVNANPTCLEQRPRSGPVKAADSSSPDRTAPPAFHHPGSDGDLHATARPWEGAGRESAGNGTPRRRGGSRRLEPEDASHAAAGANPGSQPGSAAGSSRGGTVVGRDGSGQAVVRRGALRGRRVQSPARMHASSFWPSPER